MSSASSSLDVECAPEYRLTPRLDNENPGQREHTDRARTGGLECVRSPTHEAGVLFLADVQCKLATLSLDFRLSVPPDHRGIWIAKLPCKPECISQLSRRINGKSAQS